MELWKKKLFKPSYIPKLGIILKDAVIFKKIVNIAKLLMIDQYLQHGLWTIDFCRIEFDKFCYIYNF